MSRSILKAIQQPEIGRTLWNVPLPFWICVQYLIAIVGLGLLPVATARDVDLSEPDAFTLFAAGIIGGVVILWVIVRNIWSAIVDELEEARTNPSKKEEAEALSVSGLLRLNDSVGRPLWIVILFGFASMIGVDALSLILGRGGVLPLGLDRIEEDMLEAWVAATILFVIVRPLTEQLIFQGILYPALVKHLDDNVLSILITAAAYAVFSFILVGGSGGWLTAYWGILFPFMLGIVAGVARATTKSTWSAIGVHSLTGLFILLSAAITI